MPDPFSSDYASAPVTSTSVAVPVGQTVTPVVPIESVVQAAPVSVEAIVAGANPDVAIGLEPERYGLGKPKRIVIRGTISRG